MGNIEHISNVKHYVVQIKIEQVSEDILRDSYSKAPAEVKRKVEEIIHLVFKSEEINDALSRTINHITLMRDNK